MGIAQVVATEGYPFSFRDISLNILTKAKGNISNQFKNRLRRGKSPDNKPAIYV
jgi:3-hydroxyacyl-CoA dehydrogenase